MDLEDLREGERDRAAVEAIVEVSDASHVARGQGRIGVAMEAQHALVVERVHVCFAAAAQERVRPDAVALEDRAASRALERSLAGF